MAEWTRVTGTLTAWNEENATAEDLLAAVQEVLPTDVCPTWFNRNNIKVQNASKRLFETGEHYWNFSLPIVKTSKVPGSESLSVHLVSYVRDNAVFLGTDVDPYVLDAHKPYDPSPDPKFDSWNTVHTSHCITYGEGFKSKVVNWLNTLSGQKLYTAVISFYNAHVTDSAMGNFELYSPECITASNFTNIPFRPRYLAIIPGYQYQEYGSYMYRSVNTPNKVYTQTHGCFFLVGDTEDYAPQAESAQS